MMMVSNSLHLDTRHNVIGDYLYKTSIDTNLNVNAISDTTTTTPRFKHTYLAQALH